MNQSTAGNIYATYVSSNCYLIETGLSVMSPGALENFQTLTPLQVRDIETHLLSIMKTVRIVIRARKD